MKKYINPSNLKIKSSTGIELREYKISWDDYLAFKKLNRLDYRLCRRYGYLKWIDGL